MFSIEYFSLSLSLFSLWLFAPLAWIAFLDWFDHIRIGVVALTKLTPLTSATTSSSIHSFPGELEELQSVLHFPEEVALRITDAEYQLFYQVWNILLFFVLLALSP